MRGIAEDSVIFREVTIEKGAHVKSSIIMQGAKIGEGASLEYVILDKNVTVTAGASLKGTQRHPVIIKKGEIV
jgi:glucose-1-phosphate adenylyltransferase